MAFVLIANTGAESSDHDSVTTPALDTTGADLIVLSVAYYQTEAGNLVVSDSKGNTWTPCTAYNSSTFAAQQFYYCRNPIVGSGHTFTQSRTASYPSLVVQAWSGVGVTPFDQQNGAASSDAALSGIASGSITPSDDNELLISGISYGEVTASLPTIDSGFTISYGNSGTGFGFGTSMAYLVETTATAKNTTWTFSPIAANSAGVSIISFKAAAVAATNTYQNVFPGIGF